MSRTRLTVILVLLAWTLPGQAARGQVLTDTQRRELDRWYQDARRRVPGEWGIAIANSRGAVLWGINPEASLTPASTVKIFTTGFARATLGAGATLQTRLLGSGYVEPMSGEWMGSWALELNGDPSLENADGTGPRLAELARQLAAFGVRKLTGPLEVRSAAGPADATYPDTWARRHWGRLFAPLIGMLTLHENVVWFTVRPGARVGQPGEIADDEPQGIGALVVNYTRTVAGRRARLRVSALNAGGWAVSGTIGVSAYPRILAAVASNPRLVLERVWQAALDSAGIRWERERRRPHVVMGVPVVLAAVTSPALDSLAYAVNRRSHNLGAELLLRWASPDSGALPMERHVQAVAGTADGLRLVDGSGLSYDNRASPLTFVNYLARFPATERGRNFPLLLPANGVGTLRSLATGLPTEGVVRAKTGTLGNASTISGYLGRPDGVLVVSVMYNGGAPTRARDFQWDLFRLLGADGVTIPGELPADAAGQLGSGAADTTSAW